MKHKPLPPTCDEDGIKRSADKINEERPDPTVPEKPPVEAKVQDKPTDKAALEVHTTVPIDQSMGRIQKARRKKKVEASRKEGIQNGESKIDGQPGQPAADAGDKGRSSKFGRLDGLFKLPLDWFDK